METKTETKTSQLYNEETQEILLSYFTSLDQAQQINFITAGYKPVAKLTIDKTEYLKNELINPETTHYENEVEDIEKMKPYRLTDIEEWINLIQKDKDKMRKILNEIWDDHLLHLIYNNWDKDEITIKKNIAKKRKPMEDNKEYDDGNRCNAMVWGGGEGGRCKYKCVNNGLCKSHIKEIEGDQPRLLGYGYYTITGKGSVPDRDAQKLTRMPCDIMIGKITDIIKLRPLTPEILETHIRYYQLKTKEEVEKYLNETISIPNCQKKYINKLVSSIVFKKEEPKEEPKEEIINEILEPKEDNEELIKEYNELTQSKKLTKKKTKRLEELKTQLNK